MTNIAHIMMKLNKSNPYRTPISMVNYVDLDNLPTEYDKAMYDYIHQYVTSKDLNFLLSAVSVVSDFLDHCTIHTSNTALQDNRQHLCNTAFLLLHNVADFSSISNYSKSSQLATVIAVYKRLYSLKDSNASN